jgi:alpha-L-fucosidase 2
MPGVSTFNGSEMGGWIQYSCSPTVSAWCAQHFYLHWRYSKDRHFLREYAWPWLQGTATHLEELSRPKPGGKRVLPLSSSPEIKDNSLNAWFPNTWTNYDLALARFVFEKTAELATEMGRPDENAKWLGVLSELPPLSAEPNGALQFAPDFSYRESHRHFSHLMAIYPLGLLKVENPKDQKNIQASLYLLDSIGPAGWCGYSYSWLASLRARARDGAGARDALRIFAEAFVSPNSFHLNGDQSGKGYSSFTYDPFTLEGNFAFAAGVQEMLLQSHNEIIGVLPAIPKDWKSLKFSNLRAEGAFLVSGEFQPEGKAIVKIVSEQGGLLKIQLPPGAWRLRSKGNKSSGSFWEIETQKREALVFEKVE